MAGASNGGSGGSGPQVPVLFGACSTLGAIVCQGAASAQRLACDGAKWQAGTTCADHELCDSRSGECAMLVAECATVKPGDTVCRGDKPLTCGPDLVSADEGVTCEGACKDGACQVPTCGDKKLETGEDCDDGNANLSGACVACKPATCGDGAVYSGHEECDDHNNIAGDGCSPTCTWEAISVVAGANSTCALSGGGQVKCWGDNTDGALGQGDSMHRGNLPGQLGDALKPISLGTGRTAKSISVGFNAACAVLDNGTLKCWGGVYFGQLGAAYSEAQGDGPNEMGDNLAAIALGAGRTATSVSEGGFHTCAVLDDGEVKCWGSGLLGQLGQDNTADYSSPELLSGVVLSRKASTVSASYGNTTCALLDDGSGKCWGFRNTGALSSTAADEIGGTGADHLYAIGDYPGEMEAMPALNLGTHIKALGAGSQSSCALLDDGTVKCWGITALGQGDGLPHGAERSTLPSVPPVFLGTGRTVKSMSVGEFHVCVVLDDGGVKCWGTNSNYGGNVNGELGTGNTATKGDLVNEMGDALLEIPLGKKALKVSAGRHHTCALLEDASVVCWGFNDKGQLGLGNTASVGNAPGFMLKAVDLTF